MSKLSGGGLQVGAGNVRPGVARKTIVSLARLPMSRSSEAHAPPVTNDIGATKGRGTRENSGGQRERWSVGTGPNCGVTFTG